MDARVEAPSAPAVAEAKSGPIVPLVGLWIVGAVLVLLVVTIAGNWLWALAQLPDAAASRRVRVDGSKPGEPSASLRWPAEAGAHRLRQKRWQPQRAGGGADGHLPGLRGGRGEQGNDTVSAPTAYTRAYTDPGMPCPLCRWALAPRLARDRRSGKPHLMLLRPVDGWHFRGFTTDQAYVKGVLAQLEPREGERCNLWPKKKPHSRISSCGRSIASTACPVPRRQRRYQAAHDELPKTARCRL